MKKVKETKKIGEKGRDLNLEATRVRKMADLSQEGKKATTKVLDLNPGVKREIMKEEGQSLVVKKVTIKAHVPSQEAKKVITKFEDQNPEVKRKIAKAPDLSQEMRDWMNLGLNPEILRSKKAAGLNREALKAITKAPSLSPETMSSMVLTKDPKSPKKLLSKSKKKSPTEIDRR